MAESCPLKTEKKQRRPPIDGNSYQRIGDLQQNLRDSERRRLDLESKLFEYSCSNRALTHLKYVKLTNALKEICDWEKKALRRNQEILQDFDRIEAHARTLKTSIDKLQKTKSKYEKYMQIISVCKKSAQDQEEDDGTEIMTDGKQAGINMSLVRGSFHPAKMFMSRQMSANSSTELFRTQHKSPQPTKSFALDGPNSCRQAAQSNTMADSCVIQTNSEIQCLNESDEIDGKTSLQLNKKAATASSISPEHEKTHSVADIESVTSNISLSVEDEQSGRFKRLSPDYKNKGLKYCRPNTNVEALVHENPVIKQDRLKLCCGKSLLPMIGSTNERLLDKHGASEEKDFCMEDLWLKTGTQELDIESLDSSSDLTISVSESDNSATPTKPVMIVQGLQGQTEVRVPVHSEHEGGGCIITSPQVLGSLMSSHEENSNLPNQRKALKESDFEARTAVALDQFPKLRRKTSNLPFLPVEKLIENNPSSTNGAPKKYDSSLHSTSCQEHLYQHALFLKENHLLQKDNMSEMLNAFLATGNVEQIKTEPLSKKVLQEERVEVCYMHDCEEVSSFHSCGSPCSLLSIESDTNEAKLDHTEDILKTKKPVMIASQVAKTRDQNKQSPTKEETELESISDISSLDQQPCLGSGAYKMKDPESVKIRSEMSGSSIERSSLSRSERKKKVLTTTKSKAFWGESDDSATDIEEMLRPQNTEADDFDDFYD